MKQAHHRVQERREDDLVVRQFEVEPFDPWSLVASIPRHKSYRVFAEPGGTIRVGMGAAARVARAAGPAMVAWRDLYAALHASLGPLGELCTAFFCAAFDAEVPFEPERWSGFVPVEICVPDVTWAFDGARYTMTVVAPESTFERIERSGEAVAAAAAKLENRRGGAAGVDANEPLRVEQQVSFDDEYADAVRAALDRIKSGDAEKIVVARPIDVRVDRDVDIPELLRRLHERFPNCFVYAWRPGGSHKGPSPTFLGATPERLVAIRDGVAETGAIAGTAPRGVSARMDERHAQELLTSDKEMREHGVVGDMIVDALEPHCEHVERESVRMLKLANVQHLWSPIRGRLRPGATAVDVAEALHPTPAVGGQPRQPAFGAIRSIEWYRRGLYAGVVGSLDMAGGGELAVAIRSALVDGPNVRAFAGAGIVTGSDPAREVSETRAKSRAILDCLLPDSDRHM
jgi:menaquinone-specific isochorismate synthase